MGEIHLTISTMGGRAFSLLVESSILGLDVKQMLTHLDPTLRVSAMQLLYQNKEIEDSSLISTATSGERALLTLLLIQPPACVEFLLRPQSLGTAVDEVLEDKACVLARVKLSPLDLCYALRFQNDKEVVLTAVEIDGRALEFANEDMQDDIEVLLAAMESKTYCLCLASLRLQSIPELALLQKVQQTGTWTREMAYIPHKCNMSCCSLHLTRCLVCAMNCAKPFELVHGLDSVYWMFGMVFGCMCVMALAVGPLDLSASARNMVYMCIGYIIFGMTTCLSCRLMLQLDCLSACVKSKLIEGARARQKLSLATEHV
jgi:hypothetical protein